MGTRSTYAPHFAMSARVSACLVISSLTVLLRTLLLVNCSGTNVKRIFSVRLNDASSCSNPIISNLETIKCYVTSMHAHTPYSLTSTHLTQHFPAQLRRHLQHSIIVIAGCHATGERSCVYQCMGGCGQWRRHAIDRTRRCVGRKLKSAKGRQHF